MRKQHPALVDVMSVPMLLSVLAALVLLTAVTVASTYFDLGEWNLVVALAVATIKAALVAMFFMHLLYDRPLNALLLVTAMAFLLLFLSLTLIDAMQTESEIEAVGWAGCHAHTQRSGGWACLRLPREAIREFSVFWAIAGLPEPRGMNDHCPNGAFLTQPRVAAESRYPGTVAQEHEIPQRGFAAGKIYETPLG